jgi:hypothetical protein
MSMPSRLLAVMFVAWALAPADVAAQDVDVAIAGTGLVSIEPIEDQWSSPYLSGQLGRFGTGFGVELSAIVRRFAIAGEITTATDELLLSGRLVNGGGPNEGREALSTQRQTFLTLLAGVATGGPNTRVIFMGGGSRISNQHTRDGVDETFSYPWSLTAALDVTFRSTKRVGFVANGRYTFTRPRFEGGEAGDDQVLRAGAGVRIRLY